MTTGNRLIISDKELIHQTSLRIVHSNRLDTGWELILEKWLKSRHNNRLRAANPPSQPLGR